MLIGLIMVIFSIAMPKFKSLQKLIDRLNLVSRENFSGLMVIRAFGNEKYEESRFEQANRDLRDTTRFVQRTMSFTMPAMSLIMNLVTLVIIWVGGHAIAASTTADRRYDGFYAIWHADHHVLFDDCRDVHYGAAGGGFRKS